MISKGIQKLFKKIQNPQFFSKQDFLYYKNIKEAIKSNNYFLILFFENTSQSVQYFIEFC
jgi:hypothetical protein